MLTSIQRYKVIDETFDLIKGEHIGHENVLI